MAESTIRDRDIRRAMADALAATKAFDGVYLSGLPEDYGQAAGELRMAVIEPDAGSVTNQWDSIDDGGAVVAESARITVLARHEDPQVRDELAGLLLDIAASTIASANLGAEFLHQMNPRLASWRYLPAAAPERRIAAVFSYSYLIDNLPSLNVEE